MSHPMKRCDHDDNRKKVCALCGRKIIFGAKKIEYFRITDNLEKLIQELICSDFSITNPKYPQSVCCNCKKILNERDKNNCHRSFKSMPNFNDIVLQKLTRESSEYQMCNCYICLTGRQVGKQKKIKLNIGESLNLSVKIDTNNGMFGSKNSKVNKLELGKSKELKKNVKFCDKCFQITSRGFNHKCISHTRSKGILVDNILKLTSKLPLVQKEQICSKLIDQKKNSLLNIGGIF